jgi:hypothetical protein
VLTMLLLQIYPDPESEKAIMGSVVYCIHHKQGCQWSDELRKLKVSLFLLEILGRYTEASTINHFVRSHVSSQFLYAGIRNFLIHVSFCVTY